MDTRIIPGKRGYLSPNVKLGLLATGAILVAVLGASLLAWQLAHPRPTLPAAILEKTLYQVYLPRELPEGYSLSASSAHIQDDALIFTASHSDGRKIAFTEQAKPKDFDFAAFYQQQLRAPKNLQRVPFPSVLGRTDSGSQLLSVTTDSTWLLITSKTATEAELRVIAETLHKR